MLGIVIIVLGRYLVFGYRRGPNNYERNSEVYFRYMILQLGP